MSSSATSAPRVLGPGEDMIVAKPRFPIEYLPSPEVLREGGTPLRPLRWSEPLADSD